MENHIGVRDQGRDGGGMADVGIMKFDFAALRRVQRSKNVRWLVG